MFDLLFYTTPGVEVENWDPTKPHMIKGASDSVKIRSWTSKIHQINTAVTYKAETAWENQRTETFLHAPDYFIFTD